MLYCGETAAALPSPWDSQTDCQSVIRPATTARAAGSSAPRCSATLGQPGRSPESAGERQIADSARHTDGAVALVSACRSPSYGLLVGGRRRLAVPTGGNARIRICALPLPPAGAGTWPTASGRSHCVGHTSLVPATRPVLPQSRRTPERGMGLRLDAGGPNNQMIGPGRPDKAVTSDKPPTKVRPGSGGMPTRVSQVPGGSAWCNAHAFRMTE
jgi:hypothetical protein